MPFVHNLMMRESNDRLFFQVFDGENIDEWHLDNVAIMLSMELEDIECNRSLAKH